MTTKPPVFTGNVAAWAAELTDYLSMERDLVEEPQGQAVILLHKLPDGRARAVQDGVLMFDPQLGKQIISVSGAWEPVDHGAASAFSSSLNTLILTGTYAAVTAEEGVDLPAGLYAVMVALKVTGTGGSANFQLRLVENGIEVAVGVSNDIGNGDTVYVPINLIVEKSATFGLVLEARGNSATIEAGTVTAHRIGTL